MPLPARLVIAFLAAAAICGAQDTKCSANGQQIPGPECLIIHDVWLGEPAHCAVAEHDAWLAHLRHWSNERRIRIGYREMENMSDGK
jgi:hypothetical protein